LEQLSLFGVTSDLKVKKKEENWLLIDGNNLLNRCYYATAHSPRGLMQAPDGRYTNGIFGFLRMMLTYEKTYQARAVVMFDDGKSYRKKVYPAYKDGRSESPEELKEQFPLLEEILKHANVPVFKNSEFEADDLIASFAEQVEGKVYILSNDRDTYQLITDRVSVIVRKAKVDVVMTPDNFGEEYPGLKPRQIVDVKAIAGDSSDNIPGIPGIGDKGALSLLQTFGTVEELIVAVDFPKTLNRYKVKVAEGRDKAVFFKTLTTLHRDIPISIPVQYMNPLKLRESCQVLSMNGIISLL